MKRGFFQGSSGDMSSKRLAGFICIMQGLLMKLILFGYGIFYTATTPFDTLDSCSDSIIYVGAGLIGAGLLEVFGNKNQTKKENVE